MRMEEELEILTGRWRALSEILAILDRAGGEVTGRSTAQLLYFAGKDLGKRESAAYDRTEDLERALGWVFPGRDEVWKVSLWKNQEDEDYWVFEAEEMMVRLLFEECPLRRSCLASGIPLGGVACQAVHGYAAGMLQEIFGRRVDLQTRHAGPGACLVVLRTTLE
ncbi:MAG: hypothetical protein H5T72_01250 [Actinobacteria bacterium]|nr:hypothetical protein [Actinomycetota bacterium]